MLCESVLCVLMPLLEDSHAIEWLMYIGRILMDYGSWVPEGCPGGSPRRSPESFTGIRKGTLEGFLRPLLVIPLTIILR